MARYRNPRYRRILAPNLSPTGETFGDGTGWTTEAGWAISDGTATGTATTAAVYVALTIVSGEIYRVQYTMTRSGGSVRSFIRGTAVVGATQTADGVVTEDLIATAAGTGIGWDGSASFTGTITQIDIRKVKSA